MLPPHWTLLFNLSGCEHRMGVVKGVLGEVFMHSLHKVHAI
jgi:hypothetical protein